MARQGEAYADWPPESIVVGRGIELRRARVADAKALTAAVRSSEPELRLWLPWAQAPDAFSLDVQRRRLEADERSWEEGGTYQYLAWDGENVVAAVVLMRRVGPGGLEVGYWVRTDRAGRGLGAELAGAVTDAAFGLDGVERVELHCDVANHASGRIAEKLGFTLDRVVDDAVLASGETGRLQIWILRR